MLRKITRFLKNIWKFKRELWYFREYDYSFNIQLFCKSLLLTADFIEKNGYEVDETRLLKVKQMRRFVKLVEDYDRTLDIAESELGIEWNTYNSDNSMKTKNREIIKKSFEIEENIINEIQDILFNENFKNGKNILSWWD